MKDHVESSHLTRTTALFIPYFVINNNNNNNNNNEIKIRLTDNLKYPEIVKNARLPVNYIYITVSSQ